MRANNRDTYETKGATRIWKKKKVRTREKEGDNEKRRECVGGFETSIVPTTFVYCCYPYRVCIEQYT